MVALFERFINIKFLQELKTTDLAAKVTFRDVENSDFKKNFKNSICSREKSMK